MKACFHCHRENRDQARFCGHCGKSLTADITRQPTPKRMSANWIWGILVACSLIALLSQNLSSSRQKLEKMSIPYNKGQFISEVLDGNTEAVKLFLSAGMSANTKEDFLGQTALAVAVSNGHTETAKALLDYGASPNTEIVLLGSVLAYACGEGYTEIVQALLNHGAYVNAKSGLSGHTALHQAKQKEHAEIVRILQSAGAKE